MALRVVYPIRPRQPASRSAAPNYKRRQQLGRLVTSLVLLAIGIVWVFPFLWTLGSSLKSPAGFFREGLSIIPKEFQWDNYIHAWNDASFGQFFFNTVFITVMTVALTVLLTAMAGYVLAQTSFPGKTATVGLIGVTLFLPHGYTILPVFDIVQKLHLLDTLWAVILVQVAGNMIFSTFLFYGYFSTMDRQLQEAAIVDGANFHQVFWQILLPLAGPMIATVTLFTFISSWNNFFVPLVFTLGNADLQTLSVGLYAFVGHNSTNWTYLCAGSVITLAPIMLVFMFLQRFFVNGVAGAIKG